MMATILGNVGLKPTGAAATILMLVASDGTAASPHAATLGSATATLRDLTDAVHALAVVHGAFPGIVDHAMARTTDDAARDWLTAAGAAMTAERSMLIRLASAVGPLPSTPNQAASQAAILGQRHTLEMLAQSDRNGCATGTALAFVLDWAAVRRVLDSCADRVGLRAATDFTATSIAAHAFVEGVDATPPVERAMAFGAQQMLAQHRGLWHLLAARATARAQL
ncbi:DUF6975 family protein [Sphingomonas adhaesiva]|uniref:DUF6975 family protein n=1 Tax=Sphingomonas adhaesiva TaxID=28212 RepID=UPI002FF89E5A